MSPSPVRVVFVCSGNICRSPTAEVVMRALVAEAGLAEQVVVSSAGLGDWHVGQPADPRSAEALSRRGYDAGRHRARQFEPSWFAEHDIVVALDRTHLRDLRRMAPAGDHDKVRLLLSFDPHADADQVPDPYYGGPDGFDDVLEMIERACRAMLAEIRTDVTRR